MARAKTDINELNARLDKALGRAFAGPGGQQLLDDLARVLTPPLTLRSIEGGDWVGAHNYALYGRGRADVLAELRHMVDQAIEGRPDPVGETKEGARNA